VLVPSAVAVDCGGIPSIRSALARRQKWYGRVLAWQKGRLKLKGKGLCAKPREGMGMGRSEMETSEFIRDAKVPMNK